MCVPWRWFRAALCAWVGFAAAVPFSLAADGPAGRQLFVERWTSHDKRSPSGDGLGPMHNAASCAACHHQAGPGGSGDLAHNVELLSVVPVERKAAAARHFAKCLIELHPGFKLDEPTRLGFHSDEPPPAVRPNLVLHRFGPEADYFDFRARLLGIEQPRADTDPAQRAVMARAIARRYKKNPDPVTTLEPVNGIKLKLSQRNTPALWGAGLIDAIPATVIEEYAKSQRVDSPHVAGRVPRAGEGGVGRFGWRGQTGTLRAFVLGACANELGLQTEGHRQAINPLNPEYRPDGGDMHVADIDALVSFVGNLPRPIEDQPATPFANESAVQGERVFERIGCSDCHPRHLGRIDGLFSDLLLHDMGADFADPVEPNPELQEKEMGGFHGGYFGGGRIFEEVADPTLPQQWRTPPLWGVKDSAPYLHDGRAATLAEAINLHGGQGATAAGNFRNLPRQDRALLIAFLETLAAPQPRNH